MTFPTRILTLAAAAAFLALGGAGVVSSAPSPVAHKSAAAPSVPASVRADSDYRPGMDGVDLAAITGLKGSALGKVPACADPARRGDLRPC